MEFSKLIFLFFGFIALSKSKPTQDDIQIEVRQLLNQYQASDATNVDIECPCIKATECKRTLELLTKAKELSKLHPERKEVITYIRSQICDQSNQGVKCCPENLQEKSNGDKESGTWKPLVSQNECGDNLFIDVAVVGGKDTKFGDYPFMALLGYKTRRGFCRGKIQNSPIATHTWGCGASVINKHYLLTAAHCFINQDPILIALGEHDLERKIDEEGAANVIYRGIEKIIIHDKYDKNFQRGAAPYDIALIRVNESIPLFDKNDETLSNVKPICLPWKENDPDRKVDSGNGDLTVLGWGRITNDEFYNCISAETVGAGVGILQQLSVPFLPWKECREHIPQGFQVDEDTLMCAGGETGKDSCKGDSGGPLVTRSAIGKPWFQVGLVSFGPQKCGNGGPGYYTKVAQFLQWIEENLEP